MIPRQGGTHLSPPCKEKRAAYQAARFSLSKNPRGFGGRSPQRL